jgi:hypothetical protein
LWAQRCRTYCSETPMRAAALADDMYAARFMTGRSIADW